MGKRKLKGQSSQTHGKSEAHLELLWVFHHQLTRHLTCSASGLFPQTLLILTQRPYNWSRLWVRTSLLLFPGNSKSRAHFLEWTVLATKLGWSPLLDFLRRAFWVLVSTGSWTAPQHYCRGRWEDQCPLIPELQFGFLISLWGNWLRVYDHASHLQFGGVHVFWFLKKMIVLRKIRGMQTLILNCVQLWIRLKTFYYCCVLRGWEMSLGMSFSWNSLDVNAPSVTPWNCLESGRQEWCLVMT